MFPASSPDDLDANLEHLGRSFINKCSFANDTSIDYAQFRGTPNEDRFAISEDWKLHGHIWQFLAVFDGHGGSTTAEYLAKHFPSNLRRSMERSFSSSPESGIPPPSSASQSSAVPLTAKNVSEFLKREVRWFDEELGHAVKTICPHPENISDDKEAHALYEAHKEVIARARCGSTMAGILVDKTENKMWVCCVGDSSVVLSTKASTGRKRTTVLVNDHHTGRTPQEYHRVSMAHPSLERDNIWLDGEDRIFGTLSMTRAFGDFMFKFPTSFTTALFSKFPSSAMRSVETVLRYNRTPPYVISDPSVKYVDLTTFSKDVDPVVVIYTDGLETLANGLSMSLKKSVPDATSGTLNVLPTAVDIIGALLGQHPDLSMSSISLSVENLPENNAAFNLMYELLRRTISGKLRSHLMAVDNAVSPSISDEDLYIDDITVIVFRPISNQPLNAVYV
ncbi:phosphatase 2C-like domain-containing protein [Lentinula edodes]|uniref:Phosphatase 2C-like domain-containing protein n=1 Tax=Lentinula lateritia TaxID=40482 RepID=A0A9W9DNK4_9AGAR|nr:phosphatase 2C-like domain-containing protein [Lentinula edodes]